MWWPADSARAADRSFPPAPASLSLSLRAIASVAAPRGPEGGARRRSAASSSRHMTSPDIT